MLKLHVPVYFCSIASIIAMPTEANPGQPVVAPGKNILLYTAAKVSSTTVKKDKISLAFPGIQGKTFVRNYIRNNDEDLYNIKRRSEIPFSIIDSVFNHYGLPLELKYLAVIESDLKTSAVSKVGAKGPWQLMPETAHDLGLKINRHSDERTNYYKSTRAAARYLRDLHKEFGDWLLVLAAYNGGPLPVHRAIHRAHSRNFWVLQRYLPAESRAHVKRFIATAHYFEDVDTANSVAKVEASM